MTNSVRVKSELEAVLNALAHIESEQTVGSSEISLAHNLSPFIDFLKIIFNDLVKREGFETQSLEKLVEALPIALSLKDARDDYKIKIWNKKAEEIFRVSKSAVIGKRAHDIWPQKQADAYLEAYGKIAREGFPVQIVESKNFSNSQDDVWVQTIKIPLRLTLNSEIDYLLCLFTDITEQKNRNEQFKRILKYSPCMIYQLKIAPSGKIDFMFVSDFAFELFEITKEEFYLDNSILAAMVDREDYEKGLILVKANSQNLSSVNWTGKIKCRSGHVKWLRARAVPTPDYDGRIIWDGVLMDVTHEVDLEKQLSNQRAASLHASKLASLGEMSAGIAHEINNPLTIIAGTLELLTQFISDPEKLSLKISKMKKAAERISKIVLGLQKFSRSTAKKRYGEFSIKEILLEVLTLTEVKAHKHEVQVYLDIRDDAIIYCDEVEIEQVFVNLITNAIDAVKSLTNKWVRVEVESTSEGISVRVKDSGLGIPEEIRTKLFDPFFTTKGVGEGTGLGLSIAKGILSEHGATISFDSGCPNTCFEIQFKKHFDEKLLHTSSL